jgi:hypothetical protein
LHATNAMLESYHCETIPQLLQELEDIYTDLCNIVADAVLQGAEAIGSKVSINTTLARRNEAIYLFEYKYHQSKQLTKTKI